MNVRQKEKSRTHHARLSREEIENIRMQAKAGASLRQISTRLHLPSTTVYYHAKKLCRKMTSLELDVLSEKEQGYLIGMFVGDGAHIIRANQGHYITKFSLAKGRDENIAEYMQGLFAKAGKRIGWCIERNSITLRVFSKEFFQFMVKYVTRIEQVGTHRKKKLLIDHGGWSKALKSGFISGLIDSDGYVYFDPVRGRRFGVLIRTADCDLRDQIISVLKSLNSASTTYVGKYHEKSYSIRPQFVIYVPTKELDKLSELLIAVKLRRQRFPFSQ